MFIFVALTSLAALFAFVSGRVTKVATRSPKIIHHVLAGTYQAKLYANKIFSLNSVLQIVRFKILF